MFKVSNKPNNFLSSASRARDLVSTGANIYRMLRKRRNSRVDLGHTFKKRYIQPRTKTKTKKKRSKPVKANTSGTTRTTTRIIKRKATKDIKFMKKIWKVNPQKIKYINRFGFSWVGATANSKTIWYSVCHLKFNNLAGYLKNRVTKSGQTIGSNSTVAGSKNYIGNGPSSSIYLGKCTFQYELYNPTNYIVTVYIYDLIAKRDSVYEIDYSNANAVSGAPESQMMKGSMSMTDSESNPTWAVADPTLEYSGVYWNTIGIKPTDYHLFNTMWKIKGVKKIILPPQATHTHNLIYQPKKVITNASLFYPHEKWTANDKYGVAGITQATLFGFEGQVSTAGQKTSDNLDVGTLPGKMVVKCVKKINVYNFPIVADVVYSDNNLKNSLTNPLVLTDLTNETPFTV